MLGIWLQKQRTKKRQEEQREFQTLAARTISACSHVNGKFVGISNYDLPYK